MVFGTVIPDWSLIYIEVAGLNEGVGLGWKSWQEMGFCGELIWRLLAFFCAS
jgi:hypothetical protein